MDSEDRSVIGIIPRGGTYAAAHGLKGLFFSLCEVVPARELDPRQDDNAYGIKFPENGYSTEEIAKIYLIRSPYKSAELVFGQ